MQDVNWFECPWTGYSQLLHLLLPLPLFALTIWQIDYSCDLKGEWGGLAHTRPWCTTVIICCCQYELSIRVWQKNVMPLLLYSYPIRESFSFAHPSSVAASCRYIFTLHHSVPLPWNVHTRMYFFFSSFLFCGKPTWLFDLFWHMAKWNIYHIISNQ